jgi:hypothetical protein
MLRFLLFWGILLAPLSTLFSQITVTGQIVDETSKPLSGVIVRSALPAVDTTDAEGKFSILHPDADRLSLKLEYEGLELDFEPTTALVPNKDYVITFPVNHSRVVEQELPSLNVGTEEEDATSISGLLQSGSDQFSRLTDYTFSPSGFIRRGLEDEYSEGYMNLFPINDLESGGVYFSNWGGLNDVTKQNEEVIGADIADWGVGGVSSAFNTDLRASSQWRQKKISYAVTNRNYRNRIMGTWSTGLLPSGWALSLSASRRWSQEGYIPGTFYDGYSYFASVDRKFNDHHSLNFVVFASPYKRGGDNAAIQEMYDLSSDHYYNSAWGYQQGEKRNSKVYSGNQPHFILRYDWHMNEKLTLTTALGYQTGKNSTTALDWLFANDPRPDYYRRLPSFQDNQDVADEITNTLTSDQSLLQVQWDNLYQTNYISSFTVQNVDGVEGNDYTGALSHYIVEERRNDINKKAGNIVLEYLLSQHSQLHVGGSVIIQDTRNYKLVNDLLGGEFYLDWDKYALQDFPGNSDALQNDLLRPNRIVHEGEQFGYDYESKIRQESGWASFQTNTKKWELGVTAAVKNQVYWRDSKVQNGKFPDNSLGESAKHDFFLPTGKGLIRYKLNGRNYFTLSGMYSEMAPTFRNAYISPRTRDNVVDGLVPEKLTLGEIRYDLRAPYLKMEIAGFYIISKDGIKTTSFYHDDLKTFVNFTQTGIDKQYRGVEGSVEYTLFPGFSLSGAACIGEYIYTSRPTATITQDNDGSVLGQNITIYSKNLYVAGTPQTAYTLGMTYKAKHFWSFYANVNRYENNWVNFNPLRRTTQAVDLVEYQSDQWNSILSQEKLDPAWTVDISFYKSFLVNWLKDRSTFALNIGINNLLNNTKYINDGFEQYRFDYTNKDVSTFPTKYSYMEGLNYFIQGSLKF